MNLIEDLAIEAFTKWAQDYIKSNFINAEWFKDALEECQWSYCNDIENEEADDDEFENRLEQEKSENGCYTTEEYVELLCEEQADPVQWFLDNFGEDAFNSAVEENNLINWDEVIEWSKEVDGRGCLASYDGEENKYENYYIYRIN